MQNHNLRLKIYIVLFISFAFCTSHFEPALAATWLDPDLKWKTLETPHFSIHYHLEIAGVAQRFAPIAEDVHAKMTKVFQYAPKMKTEIVLADITDFGNGITSVIPYPMMVLYISDLGTNLRPYKYDDYLRYLFIHEYSHVLHLDIVEGLPTIPNAIMGRWIFPNAIEPWYMLEGVATYMETAYGVGGRGRDPRWQMMMRQDVVEDNLKTIDEAAVSTVRWPLGQLKYLYGVMFVQYLAEKYGEDKLIYLFHNYGNLMLPPPFFLNSAFIKLYGQPLAEMWREWLASEKLKYKDFTLSLGKVTEPVLVTTSGYQKNKPRWSKDGGQIYYLTQNADAYPQIRRVDVLTSTWETLFEGKVHDDTLALASDGQTLYFSKSNPFQNYYNYKDLYKLDLKDKSYERLSYGARLSDVALSPDGQTVISVKNDQGTKRLQMIKPNQQTLGSAEVGVEYFSPTFTPDGQEVIVAKYQPGGRQNLYKINLQSKIEQLLPTGDYSSTEANPCLTPDGRYVIYESDRTGVVNLYAYERKSGQVYQVTNMTGGAFMPAVSPDGSKLAYISYSSKGYDIAVSPCQPATWQEIQPDKTAPQSPLVLQTLPNDYPIHDYDPLRTLLPKFWFPFYYHDETGYHTSIYTTGMDPLEKHFYLLNLGYNFSAARPTYTAYYINNQWWPRIVTSLTGQAIPYTLGSDSFWERDQRLQITGDFITNGILQDYDQRTFTLGLQAINLSSITDPSAFAVKPDLGQLRSLILGWRYKDDRRYVYSISPEDGHDISAKVELFSSLLGSQYQFTNYSAQLLAYQPTWIKHNVLASNWQAFYSHGCQMAQSNFSWKYLTLRGYPGTYLKGNKGASLSLEYRYPIYYIDRGFIMDLAFLDRLWGSFFLDMGTAQFASLKNIDVKKGIGGEINLETKNALGYLPIQFKLGYACGLDAGGEKQWYFTLAW